MRAMNSKSGNFVSTASPSHINVDDRQPCWYADMEQALKKKDYKWKVGCKQDGKTEEYSFKVSKAGDVNDSNFWDRVTGIDFASELIDLFRQGGQKSVKDWIRNGCP